MVLRPRPPARSDYSGCCYALGSGAQRFCDTVRRLCLACCMRLSWQWWILGYRLVVVELRETTLSQGKGYNDWSGPVNEAGPVVGWCAPVNRSTTDTTTIASARIPTVRASDFRVFGSAFFMRGRLLRTARNLWARFRSVSDCSAQWPLVHAV